MVDALVHRSHSEIAARLKRSHGHLRSVIDMIEDGRPCLDIAQQLHAVEKAVAQAKRLLIQDHVDNCLEVAAEATGRAQRRALDEFKTITKYL